MDARSDTTGDSPHWVRSPNKKSCAHWSGLILTVGPAGDDSWWWMVFDEAADAEVAHSEKDSPASSVEEAKSMVEEAARRYLLESQV